jgi:hypothetical protein
MSKGYVKWAERLSFGIVIIIITISFLYLYIIILLRELSCCSNISKLQFFLLRES